MFLCSEMPGPMDKELLYSSKMNLFNHHTYDTRPTIQISVEVIASKSRKEKIISGDNLVGTLIVVVGGTKQIVSLNE